MPEIDLPTVIFALVALFVAWKLRSVLGMRQDFGAARRAAAPLRRVRAPHPLSPSRTRRPRRLFRWPPRIAGKASPSPILPSGAASTPSPAADRSFSPQDFLSGARGVYDMVVHAFAAGDSDALKSLMSPEAFANFESAIHARANAGHTMSTTVVSIDNATIAAPALVGQTARISVRFSAKLASVTRDAQGEVVDGSPTRSSSISTCGHSRAIFALAIPTGS